MDKIFGQNAGSSIVHQVNAFPRTIIRNFKNFDGTKYSREEQVIEYIPVCGSGTIYTAQTDRSASTCYVTDAEAATCARCLKASDPA